MINGVSGASPLSYAYQNQPTQSQPPAKPLALSVQDSVVLSSAAKATGDVDHDGDSK